MDVYHMHASEEGRGHQILRIGGIERYNLSCGYLELNVDPLGEQ